MGLFPFPGEKNLWRPSQRTAPMTGKGTQFGQVSPKHVLNAPPPPRMFLPRLFKARAAHLCSPLQSSAIS